MQESTHVGLDVHKQTIAVAVPRPGSTECDERTIANTPEAPGRLFSRYPDRTALRACYAQGRQHEPASWPKAVGLGRWGRRPVIGVRGGLEAGASELIAERARNRVLVHGPRGVSQPDGDGRVLAERRLHEHGVVAADRALHAGGEHGRPAITVGGGS